MIKHWIIIGDKNKGKYACNGAVEPSLEKIANNAKEITCKNCIRFYHKHIGDMSKLYPKLGDKENE